MKKSAENRVVLDKAAEVSAAKTKLILEAEALAKSDLMEYKLCDRKCVCTTDECKWLHYGICNEVTCGALIPPMASCTSDICKRARQQEKKRKADEKKTEDAANKVAFAACKKAHDEFGTETLNCPCNLDDMLTMCKWAGWAICSTPPCDVLVPPLTLCKKRACAAFRKSQPAVSKRKPVTRKPSQKKKRRSTQSSAQQFSDSSEDDDTDAKVTPRKSIPRKSSVRSIPVRGTVYDSETSVSEDESASDLDLHDEDDPDPAQLSPDPAPRISLQRDATVTLPDTYEVEKILSGPREDGKFRVKWVGFAMKDCTWEPQKNLPSTVFDEYYTPRGSSDETSDESGDDRPIHMSIPKKVATHANPPDYDECLREYVEEALNVRRQKIADAAQPRVPPRRNPRITPLVAKRTTFESRRLGLRLRTGRAQNDKSPKK
jgi:hypothetical protein